MSRLGLVLLASANLLMVTLRGDAGDAGAAPRVVFLSRAGANGSTSFQSFERAFRQQHPDLARSIKLSALVLPDGSDAMVQALRERDGHADVLIALNGAQARAARQAQPGTPLVFAAQADPRKLGIASSMLKRPEPSTGLWINDTLDTKRLELLLDAYPQLQRFGVLGDPEWYAGLGAQRAEMQELARSRRVELTIYQAASLEAALQLVDGPTAGAVQAWCLPRSSLTLDTTLAAHLTARHRPVLTGFTPHISAAQMAYSQDRAFVTPALADLVARVLYGEAPGAIPIQVPHRFQLTVRMPSDSAMPALSSAIVRRADLVIR